MQLSTNYRFDRNTHSLYKLNAAGDAYIHCAKTPASIRWLSEAIAWYEDQ